MFFAATKLSWRVSDSFIKKRIAFAISLVFAASISAALAPVLLKIIVDSLAKEHTAIIISATASLIIGYAAIHWISRSLREYRAQVFGTADHRIRRRLSMNLFTHLMHLPMQFHLDRKTGALTQTFAEGIAGYRLILNHLVFTILPVVVELVTITIVLISIKQQHFLIIVGDPPYPTKPTRTAFRYV